MVLQRSWKNNVYIWTSILMKLTENLKSIYFSSSRLKEETMTARGKFGISVGEAKRYVKY